MIDEVDLVLYNGYIKTIDSNKTVVEAVAIKDGLIIAVGSNKEIKANFPKTKDKIDLKGKYVCPGFIDTHTHILSVATGLSNVLLHEVKSPQEAIEKIKERVDSSPKGKWILGSRWDESNWSEKRFITLHELDEIAPENPCYITRVCGHVSIANTLALKELEIALDDPDLAIDPNTGRPKGILDAKIRAKITQWEKLAKTQEEIDNSVVTACKIAHEQGLTSITDNLPIPNVKAYIKAWKNGELNLRVYMNIPRDTFEHYLESGIKTGFGDNILRLGGVKIFTDGSLGARTAALKEPYFDDKSVDGMHYIENDVFIQTIETAVQNGWQTATHAIGDRAIEMVISAFERLKDNKLVSSGRHRIEHAEYLTEDLLNRANKLGIILSMQPNFPGRWGRPGQLYEIRLGPDRYKLLNNFKSIIASKAKLCFGSDGMPMSPLFGIWSVVTHPIDDIKISLEDALYYYTLGAAFASFEENIKGSIEAGKVADLVVLERNLDKINPEEIKDVEISMTIFNGKVVYTRDN
jgi:predicted amidohydrolase YtcJ